MRIIEAEANYYTVSGARLKLFLWQSRRVDGFVKRVLGCAHGFPALIHIMSSNSHQRFRLSGSLLWLAILLAGLNCRQAVSPAGAPPRHVFTDELNRPVAVVENPQRLISLAPNVTEMLFALGLDERIVGVTSYCDFPAAAQTKAKLGATIQPDLEQLIALKPDLVVVSTASQLERLTRQLEQLNIPLYVTDPHTVRDVVVALRHLGEVTGAHAAAQTLAAQLTTRINQAEGRVAKRLATQPKPRVLFVLQLSPLITAGPDTFIHNLITLAGGISIAGDAASDYPQFSRETVLTRAPEVIIAPALHGTSEIPDAALRAAFATTPAVRQQRIVRINPDLTSRPGPRLVDALEQLAEALHPTKPWVKP